MIAIFRSNPQAFGSNINQLRAGSVLRLPDSADVATIDRGEAAGEVRRQMAEWANRAGAPTSDSGTAPRLVLVPPAGNAGAGTGTGNATNPPATTPSTSPAPATVPGNRMQVGGADLARVQEDATKTPPATPVAPPPTPPAPASEAPVGEANAPAAVQTEPTTTPPVAAPKPAVAPQPAPVAVEPESSILDTLKAFWYVPAGLVVLLVGALGMRAARRRRATASDGFAPFAIEPTLAEVRDTSVDTLPLRKPADTRDPSIVVEESAVPRTVARKEAPRTVDLDESPASTPSVDATGSFEQGDPLAEADFHMAYGLYDQAADLVKLAIAREPARRDLKLKLLEVYFVWGNKEQFLQMARDLGATRDAAQPGEWEKVVIMGKQLAPEDPLFTQSYSGVSPSSVDLNLEGGQNLVDFDLPSESSTRLPALGDGAAADAGLGGLDFVLDDPARGADGDSNSITTQATQQVRTKSFAIDGPTIEQPFAIDGPTVEQPALGLGDTLAGKLGAPRTPLGSTDQTAELSLDDLGLDLGKLEATGTNLLDDSQLIRGLDSDPEDAETLVAGLDDTSRQLLERAGATQATELLPLSDLNSGDTSRVASLDLNLDAESNAETGKRAVPDFSLDLDVGSPEQHVDGEYQRTQRIDQVTVSETDSTQRDLEPVSMSEVGTKLDLARAYMDMGDPDGARSILGEVLAEGSPTQRQEAQRLLDSIPG
jgi:pilus assembly protein FimV